MELLVVIGVIGAISAIAIPFIGDTSEAARVARSKRNAQSLASMYTTGETAGVDFFSDGDLPQTILNVVTGSTVASGAFAGQSFGVPGMTDDEQVNAAAYLELAHGMLVYKAEGS